MSASVMQFAGSLLSEKAQIVASWDIEQGKTYANVAPLRHCRIGNAALAPLSVPFANGMRVNLINAMGVTMGDSIVGLNVCHYLKRTYPAMHIHLIRPETPLPAVDALYARALRVGIIDTLTNLPLSLGSFQHTDINIDLGNQLYRDTFQTMEMHDYFFLNTGLLPAQISEGYKRNHWLALETNKNDATPAPFVLFCPGASTPLRAIPPVWHSRIITELQRRFALPVRGFSALTLPGYQNISAQITTTDAYIDIISKARFVYTADSSALHIAAAFDIPTHAIFTSIDPMLRVRYYPHVTCSVAGACEPDGLHASTDTRRLARLHQQFADFYQRGIM